MTFFFPLEKKKIFISGERAEKFKIKAPRCWKAIRAAGETDCFRWKTFGEALLSCRPTCLAPPLAHRSGNLGGPRPQFRLGFCVALLPKSLRCCSSNSCSGSCSSPPHCRPWQRGREVLNLTFFLTKRADVRESRSRAALCSSCRLHSAFKTQKTFISAFCAVTAPDSASVWVSSSEVASPLRGRER